ncbi:MAG: hypothetical protein K2H12_11370 [Acetatifactor sp.]|nr:hypothetical protein [Lachnospiraceae bacterium]MDE5748716.1 hypothetical protein [Acetatifactor sp.]MDE5952168.1 hypothetical protein [Acetatifactor sp.]
MLAFISSFFSYLLLMLVIVAVAGVATFIGITLRKKKNQAQPAGEAGAENAEGE